MTIIAVGDIMPGGLLSGVNEGYVSDDIINLLSSADLRVGTLETAVGNEPFFYEEKMRRRADVIYVKEADLLKLQQLHINIVSLANNHYFDLGPKGALRTIELLDKLGIKHIGAGKNLEEASKPVVIENNGKTVAFLAFCDWRENNVGWCPFATETEPGICPMYEDFLLEQICRNKKKYDYVVVIPHWGKEYESSPALYQYKLVKKMIKSGASLILGGHTHTIQPIVSNKHYGVAFSMGNFLFPDRLLNTPRSTWYPDSDLDVSSLPVTNGYPYYVDGPTLKLWKPIARRGLIVIASLDFNKNAISMYCKESNIDQGQFLSISDSRLKFPFFAFLFKSKLYPLYCFLIRVKKSLKSRLNIH